MKSIVPYTKEIEFTSPIAEICSISLEHELSCSPTEVEGNFIVSGEFRSHAVSVNKEPFSYKLPFSLEVTENIDKDSIDFEITDFTYDVISENTLKVSIEFMVSADEMEKEPEVEEIDIEKTEEVLENNSEKEEVREAVMEEINHLFSEETEEKKDMDEEKEEEKRLDEESETLILNSATETENEFATYHIHIVKEGDTVESICAMYQTESTILKNYNNEENFNVGDKIIIPCLDE